MENNSLGEMIKQARRDKKISQSSLSIASGITQTYLSQIESDKKIPSIEVLKNICFSLDFDLQIKLKARKNGK